MATKYNSSTYNAVKERRSLVTSLVLKDHTLDEIHGLVEEAGFTVKRDVIRKDIDLAQAEVKKLRLATPLPTIEELHQKAVYDYKRLQALAELKGDIKTAITALDRQNALHGINVTVKTQTVNQTINNTQINTVTPDAMKAIPLDLRKSLMEHLKNNKGLLE